MAPLEVAQVQASLFDIFFYVHLHISVVRPYIQCQTLLRDNAGYKHIPR